MSKSKSSSKAAKPAKPDVLTKVKDAAVTKPAQAIKAKSKDLAKMVVGKEEKKSKKGKKAKEPTPEPSESEDSDSSASSESESEEETKPVSNGKAKNAKPAPKADSSDDSESDAASDSDSSEEEAPKANGNAKKAEPVKAKAAADSSDESEDDSSEDEQTAKKSAVAAAKPEPTAESDGSDSDSSDSSDDDDEEVAAKPTKRKAEDEAEPTAKKTKTEAVDTSKGANLFVGNLSWNIDEAWLKEAFEEHGEVSSARIVTDRETGRSRGFGYVEFVNAEDASKAQAAKHGAELDGRNLNVDFGNTRPDKSQQQENRRKSYGDQVSEQSDTLFIGNLSFDVGQESVTEAFQSHGTILGIRLPTDRETGQPKGFGYVTFASVEESAAALEAMQGAYISGRPIRLDYSSPRPQNSDSPARGRGGFGGGRGGGRGFGGRGGRGGRGGDRGFGGRGGRGGRGGSTNRGGFGDFSGRKTNFD